MGWFKERKEDIANSPFFMAGTQKKILELQNDSLLPQEIIDALNMYDETSNEYREDFERAESEQEEANKQAEKYQEEYQNAKTRLATLKKQRGIFGKFFTSKIATVLLGGAVATAGIMTLGPLLGIGAALGTFGLKMLGSAAYCNLTMGGKEYRRLKRTIKISQAKYNYYDDISKIRGKDAEIALKAMKNIDRHKNEFQKAIVLQSKNYKDEFKLIREFDKLDPQKRYAFEQMYGETALNKLEKYTETIRNNWFLNNNGIERTCNINGVTKILEKLRNGKEVDPDNVAISGLEDSPTPEPDITRQPTGVEQNESVEPVKPIKKHRKIKKPRKTEKTRKTGKTGKPRKTRKTDESVEPVKPRKTEKTGKTGKPEKTDESVEQTTKRNKLSNQIKVPDYNSLGIDRNAVQQLADELKKSMGLKELSAESFLASFWFASVNKISIQEAMAMNKAKEDEPWLNTCARGGAAKLRKMLDGELENEELQKYADIYIKAMEEIANSEKAEGNIHQQKQGEEK